MELGAQEERNQEETGEIPISVWTPSVWSLSVVQLGQGWWMFVSGVFVWGLYCCLLSWVPGFGGEGALVEFTPMSTFDDANEALGLLSFGLTGGGAWLVTAWVFLSLHRVGALIAGSLRDPPGLVVEVPGIEGFVYFPVPQRVELWIWIVLLVILGMGHPASAASILDSETSLVVFQVGRREEGQQEGFCQAMGNPVEEGSTLWGSVFAIALIIALWDTLKKGRCLWRSRTTRTIGIQTTGMDYVPLPLEAGMPHRARILYCMWRSGYLFSMEQYPSSVQEEYYGYVGGYLRRQSEGEQSSDD